MERVAACLCPEATDSEYLHYYTNTEALEFILTWKSVILMEGVSLQEAEGSDKDEFTRKSFH